MFLQKIKLTSLIISAFVMGSGFAYADKVQEDRNAAAYNLGENALGLKGYDPVAVFPEGGGEAKLGSADMALEYEGVVYHFSSAENLEFFKMDPLKYEPTYGGYCAFAMALGNKVDIKPTLFTIHDRRAHYFVGARPKRNFDRRIATMEPDADANWKELSGEEPRK